MSKENISTKRKIKLTRYSTVGNNRRENDKCKAVEWEVEEKGNLIIYSTEDNKIYIHQKE